MEKVTGVLKMIMLEMLQFLVFIIVHHLILINLKNKFLVLGEESTESINYSVDAAKKKIVLTLVKQVSKYKILLKFTLQW